MADGGAVRVLFAELGLDFDEAAYARADTLVRGIARDLQALAPAAAAGDSALASVGAAVAEVAAVAASAVEATTEALSQIVDVAAESDGAVAEVGAAAAGAAAGAAEAAGEAEAAVEAVGEAAEGVSDAAGEATAALGETEEAAKGAAKAVDLLAQARDRAAKKRAEHEAEQAFRATDEGQKHSAWESQVETEKKAQSDAKREADDAAKPVKSLDGLLSKLRAQVSKGDIAGALQTLARSPVALAAGLALATRAAFQFADAFASATEQVRDTARGLEVTTSELHAFRYAAEASGVGAARMDAALGALHTRLEAIAMRRGSDWAFRRLGIEVRDATGAMRPATEVAIQVAQALDRIPDPVRRAREAQRLLGSDARRLLDVFHTGEGGLAGYLRRVQELGGGILPEAAEASRRYTQAQGELRIATDSLRSVIATALLPRLAELVTKDAEALGWFSRMARGSRIVQVGLAALVAVGVAAAGSLLASWAAAAAPFVLAAAAIALTVLALDDLWNFIEGHNSLIGTFLGKIEELVDSMIGVGQTAHYVRELKGAWEEFINFIEAHQETIDKVLQVLGSPAAMGRNVGRSIRELMGLDNAPERAAGAEGGTDEGGGEAGAAEHPPGWQPQREAPRRGAPRVAQPGLATAVATPDVTQVGLDGRVIVAESPATRTVPAPPSAAGRGRVQHVHHHAAARYQFNLSGADPRALAAEVQRVLDRRERERSDAQHPTEGDD